MTTAYQKSHKEHSPGLAGIPGYTVRPKNLVAEQENSRKTTYTRMTVDWLDRMLLCCT